MLKGIGATLFVIGMSFLLFGWSSNNEGAFLFEMISGPILVYAGFQMMK